MLFASWTFLSASCFQTPLLAQTNFESLANSASTKYQSRDFEGAIGDYTKLIERFPEKADLYYNRALARQDFRDYDGAVGDYSKAIQLDPKNAYAYNNRGNSRTAPKNHANAIADFDKAVELNPRYASAYFNRANAKRLLKGYAGAIADYNKCLEIDPKHASAYEGLGFAQYNLLQWRPALESFRKLRELNPTQDDYSRFRIWVLRTRLGETEEATKELASHVKSLQGADANVWPAQIGRFLIGTLTEDEFLHIGERSGKTPEDKSGQICEANYYAGVKRLLAGDKGKATIFFQKCLDTREKNYDEYGSAEVELRALNNP